MTKTAVDAETSITGKKERKPRAKKIVTLEQVTAQANLLSMQDKATLCTYLKNEIKNELGRIQSQAKEAETLANGL